MPFEALEELAWHQQCNDEGRIGVWHGSNARGVRRFRVGGLCDDRFETALPRQGAGECRMAAKIWV